MDLPDDLRPVGHRPRLRPGVRRRLGGGKETYERGRGDSRADDVTHEISPWFSAWVESAGAVPQSALPEAVALVILCFRAFSTPLRRGLLADRRVYEGNGRRDFPLENVKPP
jgi:hypothetical protein